MNIYTNLSALKTYNNLERKQLDMKKNLARVSSGMKINGADDSPADYAISEKMRTMIRSLEMNKQNIENGDKLMNVAAGAVEQQMDIMETLKELAMKAADGIYSNDDRKILQGECNQLLDHLEEIAATTNYNGIPLLNNGVYQKTKVFFEQMGKPVAIENSALGIIPAPGSQKFEPYINDNCELDFSSMTVDQIKALKGKTFNLVSSTTSTPPTTRELTRYMFVGSGETVPNGFTGITIDTTSTDKARLLQQIASGINGSGYTSSATVNGDKVTVEMGSTGYTGLKFTEGPSIDPTPLKSPSYTSLPLANGTSAGAGLDLSSFDTNDKITTMIGKNIRVGDYHLVFTDSTYTGSPGPNCITIDIEGYKAWANKAELLAGKVATAIGADFNNGLSGFKATTVGAKLTITTNLPGTQTVGTGSSVSSKASADATGLFTPPVRLTGGKDQTGGADTDDPLIPGKAASTSVSLPVNKNDLIDKGFTISSPWPNQEIKFVAGSGSGGNTIGIDQLVDGFSATFGQYKVTVSGGKLNFTCTIPGTTGNNTTLLDGISGYKGSEAVDVTSPQYNLIDGAHSYIDTDITNSTTFSDLAGTAFIYQDDSYVYGYSSTSTPRRATFEFIDSGSIDPAKQTGLLSDSTKIDVAGVTDLDGLIAKMNAADPDRAIDSSICKDKYGAATSAIDNRFVNDGGKLRIVAKHAGTSGNNNKLHAVSMESTNKLNKDFVPGENAHYTLDFEDLFNRLDPTKNIAEQLQGKGFRANCSSCVDEWINIEFVNDLANANPASYNYPVDVSSVTNAEDLVKAIFDQVKGAGKLDHFTDMKIETVDRDGNPINPQTQLTLFDKRNNYRGNNAVVHDGIMSDKIPKKKDFYSSDLNIQEWTKSNQIIKLKIPRTTIDHLFYKIENNALNLTTQKSAAHALEAIDEAVQYLAETSALIGSQQNRLKYALNNVITASTNITEADSTIRDANMGKESIENAKNNILSQSAQTALAYSNQKNDWVLNMIGK